MNDLHFDYSLSTFDELPFQHENIKLDIDKNKKLFRIGIIHEKIKDFDVVEGLSTFFRTKFSKKTENKRNYVFQSNSKNIKVILIKDKDIPVLFNSGFIDSVVFFGTSLINNNINVFSYKICNIDLSEKLAVFVNKDKNFSELININKQRKLIIFSSSELISFSWMKSKSIDGNIHEIHDNSFNYLANEMCDLMIIGCIDPEKIMEECVSLVEIIFESKLQLYINNPFF
jgi:hypothetical protein